MMKPITSFFGYWYYRYLLVTELYMVEKWEILMIHIVFGIILTILGLFNTKVVLALVSYVVNNVWEMNYLKDLPVDGKATEL